MTTESNTMRTAVLLRGMARGEKDAGDRLMDRLYIVLVALADERLRGDRLGRTLDPSELVSEMYLRLLGNTALEWTDRVHFLAVASRMMRRILLDHARAMNSAKRGGAWSRITLSGVPAGEVHSLDIDLEAMERALSRLSAIDERQVRVVELRFYAGMTEEETAAALGISRRAVQIDWKHAKAWLRRELESSVGPGSEAVSPAG